MIQNPEMPEKVDELHRRLDDLSEALGDDDFRVRKDAVQRMLALSERELVTARLVLLLGEEDNVGRRNAALEGVVTIGEGAVPHLLAALAERPPHRKVLIDALGAIGDVRALPGLREALSDPDPNVRAAAAEGLGGLPGEEVIPPLRRAFNEDPELITRLAALGSLNRKGAALPLQALTPLLQNIVLRPAVLLALGISGDRAALPLLIEGLLDMAPGAREAAMAGLVALHGLFPAAERHTVEAATASLSEPALRSTIRALLEANPDARPNAAALLGWSGRREAIRPLCLALCDQHADVAVAAGQALVGLGAAAIEVLCDLLPELDAPSRSALLAFFARFREALAERLDGALLKRVQALLCDALSEATDEVRAEAARALAHLGGKEALAPLLLVAQARGGKGSAAVAEALSDLSRRFPEEARALQAR
jgi:HEAT repeat protein